MADPRVVLDPSGVDLFLHPNTQKRRTNSLTGVSALGLDISRCSQMTASTNVSRTSLASRDSASSGIVILGGIPYPIGASVGSSGLFAIGDPAGESSRAPSRPPSQSDQSYQTSASAARSSLMLLPNKGFRFEDWNWSLIHYFLTVTALSAAIAFAGAAVGLIIHETSTCGLDLEWWQGVTIYHIKVPEFYNTDPGDILGDFIGIGNRIGYLKHIGVSVVCLSNYLPMSYPGWRDPISFTGVDSRLGTIQQFENLVQLLHDQDIKVILEWKPVVTHIDHPWFAASRTQTSTFGNVEVKSAYVWSDRNIGDWWRLHELHS